MSAAVFHFLQLSYVTFVCAGSTKLTKSRTPQVVSRSDLTSTRTLNPIRIYLKASLADIILLLKIGYLCKLKVRK